MKCSTRLRTGCDKPPSLFPRPEVFSAEGGFQGSESGYKQGELARLTRLFVWRAGNIALLLKGGNQAPRATHGAVASAFFFLRLLP